MHGCVCSNRCYKKRGCCVRALVTVAQHLHQRTGPLAPRDNHSLAEGHLFFPLIIVQSSNRSLYSMLALLHG